MDLIPSYKLHRVVEEVPGPTPDTEEVPDPLGVQIPIILEVLAALDICVVGAAEYEAQVRVLYTARGVSRHERMTDDVVVEKYGVHAHQYPDITSLLAAAADPDSDLGPNPRAKINGSREYLAVAPTVMVNARDLDLGDVQSLLPRTPADDELVLELAQRWNLDSSVARVVMALAR